MAAAGFATAAASLRSATILALGFVFTLFANSLSFVETTAGAAALAATAFSTFAVVSTLLLTAARSADFAVVARLAATLVFERTAARLAFLATALALAAFFLAARAAASSLLGAFAVLLLL
ncbi:MAG TPA: hypothetical protein VKS78_06980 [Roseiarcus sp.]|nr:hypothetical protein [Roseiarcus sp.]